MRIIQALTAKLDGTISFDNHDLGLSCSLLIPNGKVELKAVSWVGAERRSGDVG
jgi:hypothetical protein